MGLAEKSPWLQSFPQLIHDGNNVVLHLQKILKFKIVLIEMAKMDILKKL